MGDQSWVRDYREEIGVSWENHWPAADH